MPWDPSLVLCYLLWRASSMDRPWTAQPLLATSTQREARTPQEPAASVDLSAGSLRLFLEMQSISRDFIMIESCGISQSKVILLVNNVN